MIPDKTLDEVRDAVDAVAIIREYTKLKKAGSRHKGLCPFHDERTPSFTVDAEKGLYFCFGCGAGGDLFDFVQEVEKMTFREAARYLADEEGVPIPEDASSDTDSASGDATGGDTARRKPTFRPTKVETPPGEKWQDQAARVRSDATNALRAAFGATPKDIEPTPFAVACLRALRARGISDGITYAAHLGCLDTADFVPADAWGVDPSKTKYGTVGLPRGVVIPWAVDPVHMEGAVWTLRVRKPLADADERKYTMPHGGNGSGLYQWGRVPGRAVVLVEGELDALHIASVAEDLCTPVATGSITGARRAQHVALLKTASLVLVAYDNEAKKNVRRACQWWMDCLPHATRWKPIGEGNDPCDMHRAGMDTRAWVEAGIRYAKSVF